MRPEKVNLTCNHCGHQWLQATNTILYADALIYKGGADDIERRLDCPNCDKGVIVKVPRAWLEHD